MEEIKHIVGNKSFSSAEELKKRMKFCVVEATKKANEETNLFIKQKGYDIDNLTEDKITEIFNYGKERLSINLEKQKYLNFYY